MDVMWVLFIIVMGLIGIAFALLVIGGAIGMGFIFLPMVIGIPLGISTWMSGYDNLGVIIIIASIVLQFLWTAKLGEHKSGDSDTWVNTGSGDCMWCGRHYERGQSYEDLFCSQKCHAEWSNS